MSDLRHTLEDAILANMEDRAAHMAYADLLSDQGDPRGEFIQVQLALEDPACPPARRQELSQREQDLFAAHGRQWLDRLAPYLLDGKARWPFRPPLDEVRFRMVRGWLGEVAAPVVDEEFARMLRDTRIARGLRRLEISKVYEGKHESSGDPFYVYNGVLDHLCNTPWLPHLRHLRFGAPCTDEINPALVDQGNVYNDSTRTQARGDGIVHVIEGAQQLESLHLFCVLGESGGQMFAPPDLFKHRTLGNLRVLQVYHCLDYPLKRLAGLAAAGRLEQLLLMPHAARPGRGSYLPAEEVLFFLRSSAAGSLTHLQLRLSDVGDAGIWTIIETGILERLRILDLRHGVVTDVGAMALAAHPATGKLERLDLQRNRLTGRGMEALRAVGIAGLRLEHQQVAGEGGRYSDNYLADGDDYMEDS